MATVRTRIVAGLACMAAAAAVLIAPSATAADAAEERAAVAARPVLSIPFPCGQEWRGQTRADHRPRWAIDFNQGGGNDDKGRNVMASAGGRVAAAGVGPGGYGNQVIIDHGGGWSTQYAHLRDGSITVRVNQQIPANKIIGKVGQSGGQSSAHLHYEQRLNGADQPIRFGTSTWVGYGDPQTTDYFTRIRNC